MTSDTTEDFYEGCDITKMVCLAFSGRTEWEGSKRLHTGMSVRNIILSSFANSWPSYGKNKWQPVCMWVCV